MTTSLPASAGPARLIASDSRIACGRPPTTVRLSRASALKVAGPQVPSADHADVALELAQRLLGLDAEQAVDPAAVEAHVEQPLLQRRDVVAGHQPGRHEEQDPVAEAPAGLVERW